jgi:aspartate carbamoyltransferase regulatory subunit
LKMEDEESLLVKKIRNGTVIDHIPAGLSFLVLKVLGITRDERGKVAVLMNAESRKIGKKDIVKVENRELSPQEVQKIAIIAPNATLNIIKDFKVERKIKLYLPNKVTGVLRCTNPYCITNKSEEPIVSSLELVSSEPIVLRCTYCGTKQDYKQILRSLEEPLS